MYVMLRKLQDEWGRHNHNVNGTLDMQMYVQSRDELNKVSVRGRNGQLPSEPQMCDVGRRGPRNGERKHRGYLEKWDIWRMQWEVCQWTDSMRKSGKEVWVPAGSTVQRILESQRAGEETGGKLLEAGDFVLKELQDRRPWEPVRSGCQVDSEQFQPGTKALT